MNAANNGQNGKDDGTGHDAADDHGLAGNGKDDPTSHDANDDKGGNGKDDDTGHL